MRTTRWLVVLAVAAGCGSDTTVTGEASGAGGLICLEGRRVCLVVPPGALARSVLVRIAPSAEGPAGALGPTYDIVAVSGERLTFQVPAAVEFRLEDYADAGVPSEGLLRVYTREPGEDWTPLGNPRVDRVRGVVAGDTDHLSPFVVLRSDRLPDGGLPSGSDAGPRDGGPDVVVPRVDGGLDAGMDAGRPDAGMDAGVDAGRPDAGVDAGVDAGRPDAGVDAGVDAGRPDAGVDAGLDAGLDAGVDAGVDAGLDAGLDAGGGMDAGFDAGFDAGPPPDAGVADGGLDGGADGDGGSDDGGQVDGG